ncbi:5'-nucleotidase C-terminal domain-containing protein [Paenalkalicoccus suaedae]|uniref:5'-nucleotidase C-terminal domain-containing protein n=1 Tax=Paenalkalicoccus suaedae TaxID=2592382 RepID=A0A859FGA5_9BACI|nr:5'-nucleotidase C-terminal domain-containing protein [Paenalkalicoccus suaedae]QKS72403.1 5'-nucleotidase C-terminal domain-containing protein [Paenalkalicoccus suaedae]
MKQHATKVALAALLPLSLLAANPAAADDQTFTLDVLHTNDMHAKIANFGKVSGFINSVRDEAEHDLYLDAGDIFSGSPVVDLQEGEPMVTLLNAMNLDLMTIGNHEFDYGQDAFAARNAESDFPWIAANMDVVDESIAIEQPEPYEIYEFGDVSVGVLGITQNPPATRPSGYAGIEFMDYADTVEEYSYLRDEVDILIALNHIGMSADRELAEEFDIFDLIIGGHSHTALQEPEVVNGTPIVQTGGDARNVGHVTLELDKATGDVSVDGYLQPVADIDESLINEEVDALVQGYETATDELLSEVVGVTNTGLNRDARWEMDVSLGNFWTDAMRFDAETDIALTNNGGLRANIAAGDITAESIYTTEPFNNEITIIEMTGEALKDIFPHSFTRSADSFGNQIDLQTSGLEYIVYTDDEGGYEDVDLFVDGEPILPTGTYTIAINNFMYEGGDGYDFSDSTLVSELSGPVVGAMFSYIEYLMDAEGAVDYDATEGRIQVKNIDEREDETPIEPAPFPFADVDEESWAFVYIDALYQAGHINGTSATTFSPKAETTRGQFSALISRVLDLEFSGGDLPLDLTGELGAEVAALYEAGLVTGYEDGTFRQNDVISRQEMAVLAVRVYQYLTDDMPDTTVELAFDDANDISAFARDSFSAAVGLGIFEGDDRNMLDPRGVALREQSAKILYFLYTWTVQ